MVEESQSASEYVVGNVRKMSVLIQNS